MNKNHLQWIVTVILYLFPKSSQIDQEYASPTGPDSELHDLGLALSKDLKEKSELEDGLTETELAGETNNDELPDVDKVELLNNKNEVTSSTEQHHQITEKVETKAKEEGLVSFRNETGKEPAEQFLQTNELKIKPSKNNSVEVKVLEKRDIENNENELLKNISDGIKSINTIININHDCDTSTKSETQSSIINNFEKFEKEKLENRMYPKEDSRKFRDTKEEDNKSDESLKLGNSIADIFPNHFNLCLDKTTLIKSQPKRKLNKADLESIIPSIQRLQSDHEEDDSSKDMQGMIGVVENIMESVGGDVREELGLPENSKSKNVINLNSPDSDDDKVQKILAVVASGLRDSLKDQSSSKYCMPLPRELHSFLIWLMHGYEGGANSPPTKSEQRSKPFYLFHEKSHRCHNTNPSDNMDDYPCIVDNSKPITFDDLSLLKGSIGQIDHQDVSPELNNKKNMVFAEKSLYGKPNNMGGMVISPTNNFQIGRFPDETERDYILESGFPLRRTYIPKHLVRTRCLGDTSINKIDVKNTALEDTKQNEITPNEGDNTSLVGNPENMRESRNISDSTDFGFDSTILPGKEVKVIKRDLSTNSNDILNKTLHKYLGSEHIRKRNNDAISSPCQNTNLEDSSEELSNSLKNSENHSEWLLTDETKDFPLKETFKEKRRDKISIFKDTKSNEVIVKLMPNSSNSKEVPYVNPLFDSAVRLKNLTLNNDYENDSNIDNSNNKLEDEELIDLYNKNQDQDDELMLKENEINKQTDTISNDDKSMNSASKNKKKKKLKVNSYQIDGLFKLTTLVPMCEETFLNLSDLLPQIYANTPASEKRNKYSKFMRRKESICESENDYNDSSDPTYDSEELNTDYDEKEIDDEFDEYNMTDKHKTVCRNINGSESNPTSSLLIMEEGEKSSKSVNCKYTGVEDAISENKTPKLIRNTILRVNNTPELDGAKENQLNFASNAVITSERISANTTLLDIIPNSINNSIVSNNIDKILNQDKETIQYQEMKDVHCKSGLSSNISQNVNAISTNPRYDIINSVKKVSFKILKMVKNNTSISTDDTGYGIMEPAISEQNTSSQTICLYRNPETTTFEQIQKPIFVNSVNEKPLSNEKLNLELSPFKVQTVESRLNVDLNPSLEIELFNKSVVSNIKENMKSSTLNERSKLIGSELKGSSVPSLNRMRLNEEIAEQKEFFQPYVATENFKSISKFEKDSKLTADGKNQKLISEKLQNLKSLIPNENYQSIVVGSESPYNPSGYIIVNDIYPNVESEDKYETTNGNVKPKKVESYISSNAKEKFKTVVSLMNGYIKSPVVEENLKAVISELKNNSQASIEEEYPNIVILEIKENCDPIIGEDLNDNLSDFMQKAKLTPADKNDKIIVSKVKRFLELRVPNEKPVAPLSKLLDHLKYFNKIEKPMVMHLEIKGKFNSTANRKTKLELSDVEKSTDFHLLDEKLQAVVEALKSYSEYSIMNKNPKVVILKVNSKPKSTREDKNFKVIASKLIRHLKCSVAKKIRGIVVFIVNDHPESILLLNENLAKVLAGMNETSEDFVNETAHEQVIDLNKNSEGTEVGDIFKDNGLKIGNIDSNVVNGRNKSTQTNLSNEFTGIQRNLNTKLLEAKRTPSAFMFEIEGTAEPIDITYKADKELEAAIFDLRASTEPIKSNEEIKVDDHETTELIDVNEDLNVTALSFNRIGETTDVNNGLKALESKIVNTTESSKFNDILKPEVLIDETETTESIFIKDDPKAEKLEVKGTIESINVDEQLKSKISDLKVSTETILVNGKVEAFEPQVKGTTESNAENEKLRKMAHDSKVNGIYKITKNNEKLKAVVSHINENTASRVVNEKGKAFIPDITAVTQSSEKTESLKTAVGMLEVNGTSDLTNNTEKFKIVLSDFKENVASTVISGQFREFVPEVKETTESTVETENSDVLVLNGTSELAKNKEKIKTLLSDFKENTAPTVRNDQFRAFIPEVRGTTQPAENVDLRPVAEVLEIHGITDSTEYIEKVKKGLPNLKETIKLSDVNNKVFVPEVKSTLESTEILNVLQNGLGDPILAGSAEKLKALDLDVTTTSSIRKENRQEPEIASCLELKGTTTSSDVNMKPKSFPINKNIDNHKQVKTAMLTDLAKPTERTLNNTKPNEVVLKVNGYPVKQFILDLKGNTESPVFNLKPKAVISEIGRRPEFDGLNQKHKSVFIQVKETIKATKDNKKFERILSALKETTESTLVHEKTDSVLSGLNRNLGPIDQHERPMFEGLKETTKPIKAYGNLGLEFFAEKQTTESTLLNHYTNSVVLKLNQNPGTNELDKMPKSVLIELKGPQPSKFNIRLNGLLSTIGTTSEAPLVNEMLKLKVSELNKRPDSFELKEHPIEAVKFKGFTKPTKVNEINAMESIIKGTTESTFVSEKPKPVISELNTNSDPFEINEKLKTVRNEIIGASKEAKVNEMLNAVASVLHGSTESTSVNQNPSSPSKINTKPESVELYEKLKLLFTELKAITESSLLNDKLEPEDNKSSDETTNLLGSKNLKTYKDLKISNRKNAESKKPSTLLLSELSGTTGTTVAKDKSSNAIFEAFGKLKPSPIIEKKPIKGFLTLVPNVKNRLESIIKNKISNPVVPDLHGKSSRPIIESNLTAPQQNKSLEFSVAKKKNKIVTLRTNENLTSNAALQNSVNHNSKTKPLVNYHTANLTNDKNKQISSVGGKNVISNLANKDCNSDININDLVLINGNVSQIKSKSKTISKPNDTSKVIGTILKVTLDEKHKKLSKPSDFAKANNISKKLVSQKMAKSGRIPSKRVGNATLTISGKQFVNTSKERVNIKDIDKIKLNTTISKENMKLNSISNNNFKAVTGEPVLARTSTNKFTKTTPQMSLQNLNHTSNEQIAVSQQNENYESIINQKQPTDIYDVYLQDSIPDQDENFTYIIEYMPLERISKSSLTNLPSKILKNNSNLINSKSNRIKIESNFNSKLNAIDSTKHKRFVNKISTEKMKYISKDNKIQDCIDKNIVKKIVDEMDNNATAVQSKTESSNTIDWNDLIKLSEQMKNSQSFDMANILKCLSDIINEALKKAEGNDVKPPDECREKNGKNKL